jgi:endoglucanase
VRRVIFLVLLAVASGTMIDAASARSPFAGRRLFTDCEFGHTSTAPTYSSWFHFYRAHGRNRRLLARIVHVPGVKWFAGIDDLGSLHRQVERYTTNVDHPPYGGPTCSKRLSYTTRQWRSGPVSGRRRDPFSGSFPVVALRAMKHTRCQGWSGGRWNSTARNGPYKRWIRAFVSEFGRTWDASRGRWRAYPQRRGAVILEPDALGLIGPSPRCLTHTGRRHVVALLRYGVSRLRRLRHVAVYLDVAAADWMSAGAAVKLLRASGVAHARGFALNSTHFDTTRHEIAFGKRIARVLHKHFVLNTAENAHGTLPKSRWGRLGATAGNCNPPNSGLGHLPTSHTRSHWVDALLWISRPGLSSNEKNRCGRGPTTNVWWEARALQLARKAAFHTAPWPARPM